MRIIDFHIHNHTIASDGKNTLLEMAEAAREAGVDLFVLTDHNTMTAESVIEDVEKATGVMIISGIEYTTFYGHALSFGGDTVPWYEITENGLNMITGHGNIAGIAHPCCIGDPLCTGCSYSFRDTDFSLFDFIEVYHENHNRLGEWDRNREFYYDRLREGVRINQIFSGDYHTRDGFRGAPLINRCMVEDSDAETMKKEVLRNISSGDYWITETGERNHFSATLHGLSGGLILGEKNGIRAGEVLHVTGGESFFTLEIEGHLTVGDEIRIYTQSEEILRDKITSLESMKCEITMNIRKDTAVLLEIHGGTGLKIATNPFYLEVIS